MERMAEVNSAKMREATRMLRQSRALTQEELGVSVGISASKLSLYETGLIDLTAKESQRIQKFFDKFSKPPSGGLAKLSSLARAQDSDTSGKPKQDITLAGGIVVHDVDAEFAAIWNQKPLVNEKMRWKFFRQRAGLTQRELAIKSKIPRNKLIKLENGNTEILTADEKSRWVKAIHGATKSKNQEDPYRQIETLSETLKKREELIKAQDQIIESDKKIAAARDEIEAISKEIIEELKTEIARLELLNKELGESKDREIAALREQLEAKKRVTIPSDEYDGLE